MTINYETLLLKRKQDLQDYLKEAKASSRPVDLNDPIGRLSRMDAIQQQQMALNTFKQAQVNLQLVEAALKRLDEGEYGVCLRCEEEISPKRLMARPEAPFCTKCS